jgi:hypothetical protein
MSEDQGSKQGNRKVQKAAKTPGPVKATAEGTSEELSPERRQELARQIEAKRYRGKPPSI